MKILFRFSAATFLGLALSAAPLSMPKPEDGLLPPPDEAFEQIRRFTLVLEQVRHFYVEEEKVGYESLIDGALGGMLRQLDPHSQYMDRDGYEGLREDTQGEFGGLGMIVNIVDGALTVVSPMEDSPAWDAGILTDDRITEIEGKSTTGLDLQQAIAMLRGLPGSEVSFRLFRPATGEDLPFKLTRARIETRSVKKGRVLRDDIGYIRLSSFNEPTASLLHEEMNALAAMQAKALVLDLRGNPGGLLQSAVEVASVFLDKGQLVVFTQGRDAKSRRDYPSIGWRHYVDWPLAILVNEGSASASEIVAGALQDHRRAVLVGERTYGKGSVQSILPMEDGSALRLTTAKYYTPSERLIHQRGIPPDIEVSMSPQEWAEVRRTQNREETWTRDPQLRRAVDVLQGVLLLRGKAPGPASGRP
jgi:carboxyl-terminal processing protease